MYYVSRHKWDYNQNTDFKDFASAKCTFKNETARGCFIIIQDKNVLNKCWITWHLTQSETSSWEVLSYCREAEALHSGNVHLLYKEQRQRKTKGRKNLWLKNPRKNANIVYYLQIKRITKNKFYKKAQCIENCVIHNNTKKENKLRAVLQHRQIIPR